MLVDLSCSGALLTAGIVIWSPMALVLSNVRAKVAGAVFGVQTMTATYYVAFCIRLAQARSAVGATVNAKVMTPISACVAKVMSTVQGIKAAGLAYVTSARQAASVAYWSLKEKGLKAYSAENAAAARAQVSVAVTDAKTLAQAKARLTRAKAVELKVATGELVASKSFQATAASATGGATMLGAGGGAAGLAVGGAAGALAGLPLALFTFGLSIPAGAVFGGGAGLAVGAATGASIGTVGGGAAGFGAYSKRDDIRKAASLVASKVGDGTVYARTKASQSRTLLQSAASGARV